MDPIPLTATPTDIIAAHTDLSAGTAYLAQPESRFGGCVVHFDDGDTEPSAAAGLKARNFEMVIVKAGTGGKLWAWAPGASADSPIALNIFEQV